MHATPADIVLCDVRMPGETGLWLTGQLRTQFPETAIVLVTSDRSVPPQISLQPGVVEYLAKPLTREDVLKAVRQRCQLARDGGARTWACEGRRSLDERLDPPLRRLTPAPRVQN